MNAALPFFFGYGHSSLEGGLMSTTFVFTWLEDPPFRHDLLPILSRLALPGDLLELERHEMGVAFVLDANPSVSSEHHQMWVAHTLDLSLNPTDEMRDTNWSTFSNRLVTSAIFSSPLHYTVGSVRSGGGARRDVRRFKNPPGFTYAFRPVRSHEA